MFELTVEFIIDPGHDMKLSKKIKLSQGWAFEKLIFYQNFNYCPCKLPVTARVPSHNIHPAYPRQFQGGKGAVKDVNSTKNNGQMKCENCSQQVQNATKHEKGVTLPKNEAHVDHVMPQSKGGSGTPNNGQVLCRGCNLEKSNKILNSPIMKL